MFYSAVPYDMRGEDGEIGGMKSKFSVLAYAGKLREHDSQAQSDAIFMVGEGEKGDSFRKWVEEIRSDLVSHNGKTEEEKQKYNDTLNRAVLGFADDRNKLLAVIHDLLAKHRIMELPPAGSNFATMAEAVFAEIIGLNVLELVLKHKEGLEEVQVIGRDIFEVRNGEVMPSRYKLPAIADLERIQQNLVLFNNASFNPHKRWAEVSLQDGSRVTITGFGFTAEPTITIRFYTVKHFDLLTLCSPEYRTIDEIGRVLILSVIRSYFNLVVIGPTNSGKTNLIKAFIAEMDDNERIITIESRYELMLKRDFPLKNIIEYEVDEEDPRHSGNQAFKLALRQSPKRICSAEIRDADANLYVRACTRGHEGSITSVHVNTLEDVPDAITDMCLLDGRKIDDFRLTKRITEYVTQIGFEMAIVQGQRKVVRIGEYAFVDEEVRVRDIYIYDDLSEQFMLVGKFSEKAARRILKYDQLGWNTLQELGIIDKN